MRVLHVIPSVAERSGGPATAIVPMCRALQQQGVEVLLVTTDAGLRDAINGGGKPPFLTCSASRDRQEQNSITSRDLGTASSDLRQEQISELGQEQMSDLRQEQISELGQEQVRDLSQEQVRELGQEQARDLSQEQERLRHEQVRLRQEQVRPRQEQVRKGGLPPLSDYKGVPAIFFPAQLGESFKYSRPLASWLNSHIREFELAHIHAVFNHSSISAAHVCRKAGVPYVIRPLGTLEPWSMTQKSVRKRLFWQVAGKAMLRRAAAVHYTTEAEKVSTEGLLGLNHGQVIGLGVAVETATLSQKKKLVLVLSRLHPKKGLDVLIEAFLSLVQQEKFSDWRLVIAGDGPDDHVSKLQRMAADSDRVQFTGWLDGDAKDAMLSSASLLALPSRQENFGMCVMEALSRSVPVLVSPHVNLAEEIVLANAGWIATVDKEALTARLAEALDDEEERTRRGRAGKQLSLRYSWESAAQSLVDLYRTILAQKNGGAGI